MTRIRIVLMAKVMTSVKERVESDPWSGGVHPESSKGAVDPFTIWFDIVTSGNKRIETSGAASCLAIWIAARIAVM